MKICVICQKSIYFCDPSCNGTFQVWNRAPWVQPYAFYFYCYEFEYITKHNKKISRIIILNLTTMMKMPEWFELIFILCFFWIWAALVEMWMIWWTLVIFLLYMYNEHFQYPPNVNTSTFPSGSAIGPSPFRVEGPRNSYEAQGTSSANTIIIQKI